MIQSGIYNSNRDMVDLSVVFVTYNRSNLLTISIDSLKGALESSGLSYELIIADDCSSGEHKKRIYEIHNVQVVRTKDNSGLGANVNNGIAHAKGRLIL